MAQPLSFMFNVHAKQVKHVTTNLLAGFKGQDTHPLPNIVHYLWLVPLPDQVNQPKDTKCMLLTTVYDEEFEPYIEDLVKANPEPFNIAASQILGLQGASVKSVVRTRHRLMASALPSSITTRGARSTRRNHSSTIFRIVPPRS